MGFADLSFDFHTAKLLLLILNAIMGNYKIIVDEEALRRFIDWLPELEPNETYYLCLLGRSKYVKDLGLDIHIQSDKAQLKRFTSNKEMLFDKIKQLEVELGAYKLRGVQIPQEALALYITTNPRNVEKATKESIKKLVDLVTTPYSGYNPHQQVLSCIQRAKSKTQFVTFDFDIDKSVFEKDNVAEQIKQVVGYINAVNVIETRGGFHVLVRPDLVKYDKKKSWYNEVNLIHRIYSSDPDSRGDMMSPVVGTYQGSFTPKFYLEY